MVKVFEPASNDAINDYGEQVIVWGTIDPNIFKDVKNSIISTDKNFDAIEYRYVDERTFDDELINAIAEGRSPDLIMLRSDALVTHRAKLLSIPYTSFPLRDFRDTYVDAGEIFAMKDGIYALPFLIDPLIMYWNRDLFATGGIAQPPSDWENVVARVVPNLTKRDTSRNILQSALAFGEYRNVTNAKEVLLTLTMQSGSLMVSEGSQGYVVEIDKAANQNAQTPLDASLEFYTDFSNANSPLYTWNRAQPSDKNAFVAEDLAIYFGKGSEAEDIAGKNPNLNFDVAEVPQGAAATIKRTYADVYGLAIPRAARNPQGAYAAARTLTSAPNSKTLAGRLGMSSAQRSVINAGDTSPYRQVVLRSALIARSWFDPDPNASDSIFSQMIEDVVSNRVRVSTAVNDAVRRLTLEY